MRNLVVVESPAKSKTIGRYLNTGKNGDSFTILATGGHIYETVSIDIENQFNPQYELIESKKKFVKAITKNMQSAERLYLATDPDREGEAISYHVYDWLQKKGKLKHKPVHRIVFHEVTGKAIQAAIDNPSEISHNLVNAQQARDALDQLVGFNLSKLLMRKLNTGGLSAGRVQSPALRLIVERQREINRFKPEEFWTLEAALQTIAGDGNPDPETRSLKASLISHSGKKLDKFAICSESAATETKASIEAELDRCGNRKCIAVSKITSKILSKKPRPPYTTSTLVQDAASRLRMSARQTAAVAQKLYEGLTISGQQVGLITYTRTDSVTLSSLAIDQIRDHIGARLGRSNLPAKARLYKTKSKNAQEAHEAIRPTDIALTPQTVQADLTKEQFALYRLIWNRAVASQMTDAKYRSVTAVFETASYAFQMTGSTLIEPGWMTLYLSDTRPDGRSPKDNSENQLPPLQEGQRLQVSAINTEQHFTQPPARYTTASLIKQLEEHGIGRPSTWPTIITKLQARKYVEMDKQSFIAKGLGCTVVNYLNQRFTRYIDYEFTSKLEDNLDEIARGERQRVDLLDNFWKQFSVDLKDGGDAPRFEKILGEHPDSKRTVIVRVRQGSPFLQLGRQEDGQGKPQFRPLPDDTDPETVDFDWALEQFSKPTGPRVLGTASDGSDIIVSKGRYGPYISAILRDGEQETKLTYSLDPGQNPDTVTMADIEAILARPKLPIHLGKNKDGHDLFVTKGRFGFYLATKQAGKAITTASLGGDDDPYALTLERALEIMADPKNLSKKTNFPKTVLKTFEGSDIQILEGRYGPYATDGKTNATIPKNRIPKELTLADCQEIITAKAAAKQTRTARKKRKAPNRSSEKGGTSRRRKSATVASSA